MITLGPIVLTTSSENLFNLFNQAAKRFKTEFCMIFIGLFQKRLAGIPFRNSEKLSVFMANPS